MSSVNKLQLTYSAAQHNMFFDSANLGRFRFFPKGRRLGATRGAAHAFIEAMLEGKSCLWGDTTHPNISRYVDRYFLPVLKNAGIDCHWNPPKGLMTIGKGFTDFRSATNPDNWEGFGYHLVFLNEAGIILNNRYLYENSVLPMLLDFPESQLIAAGTPKLRQGVGRLFKELVDRALAGEPDYYTKTYTTYDNPFIENKQINFLAKNLSESERRQEIFGEFTEPGGELVKREHLRYAEPPPLDQMYITMGVDLAISTKQSADFTAIGVIGRENYGSQRTFILDVARIRTNFNGALQFIQSMAEKWAPQIIGVEETQFQAAVVQELLRLTTLPVKGVRPDKDKVTRFQNLAARYEQGVIHHARGLSKDFEDEILSFPNSAHDDQVDAATHAFNLLPSSVAFTFDSIGQRDSAGTSAIDRSVGWGSVSANSSMGGFL